MEKQSKDKILILSAYTFGDGHKQVANAIQEVINMEFKNIEPVIIDIMKLTHPFVNNLSSFFYKLVIKSFPSLFSYMYKKTRIKCTFSEKTKLPLLFGMHSLMNAIHSIKPVAIVCTHPFAAGIVSNLKERRYIEIPNITIITDYTNHSYWIYPYTDVYIVPSNQVRIQLMELGIEHDKIYATGIPIRKRFLKMYSREALASKYGLDPTIFTLLIMGGGDGFIGREISLLVSHCSSIQVIIVCGRNKGLEKFLKIRHKSLHPQTLVKGYCENIEELMAISDLIISKPGGVTTSEAFAMNLPLIIYKPLPGQEEDNKNYLLHSELAFFAQNHQELLKHILKISKNTDVLLEMKKKYQCLPYNSSTLNAVNIILLEIGRNKIITLLITATTMKMVL